MDFLGLVSRFSGAPATNELRYIGLVSHEIEMNGVLEQRQGVCRVDGQNLLKCR